MITEKFPKVSEEQLFWKVGPGPGLAIRLNKRHVLDIFSHIAGVNTKE